MATYTPGNIYHCDAFELLAGLEDGSVQTVVTSPPYFGLRDYGVGGQIGIEQTPQEYVARLTALFQEVWRVLRDDGTVWLNLGDSYANDPKWGGQTGGKHAQQMHGDSGIGRQKTNTGLPPKSLMGIPWRVAFALQDAGWILRSDIIWAKPNAMPESVTDRPTRSHEYIFLLAKSERYYYDNEAIKEPVVNGDTRYPNGSRGALTPNSGLRKPTGGDFSKKYAAAQPQHGGVSHRKPYETRNKRSVWSVPTKSFRGAHFATFPPELITPCILAGAPVGGLVLDFFMGSGTTALVARQHGRQYIGCDLNPDYVAIANERLRMPFEARAIKANDDVGHLPLFAESEAPNGTR